MRKLTLLTASVALLVAAPTTMGAPEANTAKAPSKNIVQTAVAAKQFKTLVSLVKSAGLARTLAGNDRFTVFAPTDAAFARVPKSTLRGLKKDRARLRQVLLYHVVKGRYRAARLTRAGSVPSLAGPRLQVRKRGRGVRVEGARVVQADIGASNGVVHVINRVLVP
jgi:uncharacterized surface protein with fasciclin (FAS1) repeats